MFSRPIPLRSTFILLDGIIIIIIITVISSGPGSSVGVVTDYGTGIESR